MERMVQHQWCEVLNQLLIQLILQSHQSFHLQSYNLTKTHLGRLLSAMKQPPGASQGKDAEPVVINPVSHQLLLTILACAIAGGEMSLVACCTDSFVPVVRPQESEILCWWEHFCHFRAIPEPSSARCASDFTWSWSSIWMTFIASRCRRSALSVVFTSNRSATFLAILPSPTHRPLTIHGADLLIRGSLYLPVQGL